MQSIANCQRLKDLHLYVTVITPAGLPKLTQLSELTSLEISAHDVARLFLDPAVLTLKIYSSLLLEEQDDTISYDSYMTMLLEVNLE